jgi:hypothetical protein
VSTLFIRCPLCRQLAALTTEQSTGACMVKDHGSSSAVVEVTAVGNHVEVGDASWTCAFSGAWVRVRKT